MDYPLNLWRHRKVHYLASAYQSAGELEKAELFFQAAINNGYSDNLALYYQRSGVNYEQKGEYNKALKAYKMAWEYRDQEKSGNEKLLFEIARVYHVYLRDDHNALEAYRKFVDQSTDTTTSYYRTANRRIDELSADTLKN